MSATGTPGSAPKSMSSRLLTMKFMQRAANTSPSLRSPATPEEPSPKRRKTDSSPSTPTKFNVDALADRRAIEAALADEEAKRQAALERQAAELGDTRWILSFEDQKSIAASSLPLRVVQTGFANLDSSPVKVEYMDDEKPAMVGRRSFGKFNKVLEKQQDSDSDSSSESDSEDDDSSDSESESDDPTSALIKQEREEVAARVKAERKANKRALRVEQEEMAKKRRKLEVNLNGLSSLSGRQDRAPALPDNLKCFTCGGKHFAKDCNQKKRGYQGGDDSRPRKAMRTK